VNVQIDEDSGSDEPVTKWGSCKQFFPCFRPKTRHSRYYSLLFFTLKIRTIEMTNGMVDIISKEKSFPKNEVRNQKYSVLSFVPVVLFEQFQYFFNFYFLVVALSQFIPILQVGELLR
jgi:hypothetical protein